jgi:thiamine pyrophosphokinase
MPKKHVLIFVNGLPPRRELVDRYLEGRPIIIGADGGALHALRLGLKLDWVVGDMDSLPVEQQADLAAAGTRFKRFPPQKDKTDLELALQLAMESQPQEIVLLGALGGRLDQELGNMLLLAQPQWRGTRMLIAGEEETVYLLRGGETMVLHGKPGQIFSVLAISPMLEGLDISGAEYPLTKAEVPLGSTLTISNAMAAGETTIALRAGLALVVLLNE